MPLITARACPADVQASLEQAGLAPAWARLYAARGVTHPEQIAHRLPQLLPPAGLLIDIGAEGTLVARTMDVNVKHLADTLLRAAKHKGTAFVEILQNCNVFNDGAFDLLRDKSQGARNQIRLVHGEKVIFDDGAPCVRVGGNGQLEIAEVADSNPESIIVHDVHGRPSLAFALAHLSDGPTEPTCIGVFREVQRPTYGDAVHAQLDRAKERLGPGSLEGLLHGGDTWTVP